MAAKGKMKLTESGELHIGVPQIAVLWGVDAKTVIREFRNEPGVLRFKSAARETLRIPWSVMDRVHRRLEGLS